MRYRASNTRLYGLLDSQMRAFFKHMLHTCVVLVITHGETRDNRRVTKSSKKMPRCIDRIFDNILSLQKHVLLTLERNYVL